MSHRRAKYKSTPWEYKLKKTTLSKRWESNLSRTHPSNEPVRHPTECSIASHPPPNQMSRSKKITAPKGERDPPSSESSSSPFSPRGRPSNGSPSTMTPSPSALRSSKRGWGDSPKMLLLSWGTVSISNRCLVYRKSLRMSMSGVCSLTRRCKRVMRMSRWRLIRKRGSRGGKS